MQTSAPLFFLSCAQKVGVCVIPVTLVSYAYAGKSLPRTTGELHDIEQKFIVLIQDSVVASCSQKKSASSIYYNYTLQQLHVYKDEPTL